MSKVSDIIDQYSRHGRAGTQDFSNLSTEEKKRYIRTLLRDVRIKVEGSETSASTAKSKTKRGGAKVISAGRTQGLRTVQRVANDAGYDQYIPALKLYDNYIKAAEKGLEKAKADGWKSGNAQTVALGTRTNRSFATEDEYLDHLYSRLEEFEQAETSTNKGAIAYYRESINKGLTGTGMEVKGKTLKTLFGYGAESGEGEWQRMGAEAQEKISNYWTDMRMAMKQGENMGYESETVQDTYDDVQKIVIDNSIPEDSTEQIFIDIFTKSNMATVKNLEDRIRIVANRYGALTPEQKRAGVSLKDAKKAAEEEGKSSNIPNIPGIDLSSMIL